jgi:hypothetical protein
MATLSATTECKTNAVLQKLQQTTVARMLMFDIRALGKSRFSEEFTP